MRRGEEEREEGRVGVADRTACHFTHTIYISSPIYLFVRNCNVVMMEDRIHQISTLQQITPTLTKMSTTKQQNNSIIT